MFVVANVWLHNRVLIIRTFTYPEYFFSYSLHLHVDMYNMYTYCILTVVCDVTIVVFCITYVVMCCCLDVFLTLVECLAQRESDT